MPIYEYTCGKCRHEFEYLVRGQETPVCPACGGKKLDKRFSVPAAHTAGSSSLPVCPSRECQYQQGGACGMGGCGLPGM
ncbi:MAG: FmdB family zinc ribbon protein [Pirellulales bacterium]